MAATLTFDRSERWKDEDGHLHVRVTNLSKATVNPYRGSEIPGWQAMGLDGARIYQLFRDPAELAKAAETSNNIRLMSRHVAVSAGDPQEQLVAGSTGTDGAFVAPYLQNSLVVWRQEDINDVESREKCELSCGYYYEPEMTPGTYEGAAYDGVMRNIRFNHVALVPAGRAGPDVQVHDSKEIYAMPLASRHALAIKGALKAYLMPKVLPGTMLALDGALGSVNAANWKTQKPRVIAALTSTLTPRLAADASLTDLGTFLGAFDEEDKEDKAEDDEVEAMDASEEAEEAEARRKEEEDGASAEDRMKGAKDRRGARDAKRAMDKAAKDKAAKDAKAARDADKDDKEDKGMDKKAMDAAIAGARKDILRQMSAANEAREVVRPLIGQVAPTMDSAEDIYRLALEAAKVPLTGVHPSAFRAMVGMLPASGSAHQRSQAHDSASFGGLSTMFPAAGYIRLS